MFFHMVCLLVGVPILWYGVASSPTYLYPWHNMGSKSGRSTQYVVGCKDSMLNDSFAMYLNKHFHNYTTSAV